MEFFTIQRLDEDFSFLYYVYIVGIMNYLKKNVSVKKLLFFRSYGYISETLSILDGYTMYYTYGVYQKNGNPGFTRKYEVVEKKVSTENIKNFS